VQVQITSPSSSSVKLKVHFKLLFFAVLRSLLKLIENGSYTRTNSLCFTYFVWSWILCYGAHHTKL